MTYQELRHATQAVLHACSGVTCKTSPDGKGLMVRNDAKLGIGYKLVTSLDQLYDLLPETAGYL